MAKTDAMKIKFITKETVISSSPTLPHFRTFNLSLLDQLVPSLSKHSFRNLLVALAGQDDGTTETNDFSSFVCYLRKQSLSIRNKWFNKLKENTGDENDSGFWTCLGSWGKPTWVRMCDALETPNLATLADTSDGEGIEAWMSCAEKEDKAFSERGLESLAFASLNSSPLIQ
ncbi:hypothetical protein Vadar_032095 [Vaccinium darrowii]|uniref:Uncharacterized protein n=1 Tax=Vaccinium darrowii TaxID=229202 RepID=A0ACB7XE11_9ERIC|nr:hypothetical protein Vadar_032095 [Vaccinium darrowii]